MRLQSSGFSLVEVVIALGIVSFAFVGLFGLLPVGLNAFNNSIDATVESQIAESVITQVKQARFSTLFDTFNDANGNYNDTKSSTTKPKPPETGFYYDDQGKPVTDNPIASGVDPKSLNYVYSAGVQVYYNSGLPVSKAPSDSSIASGTYSQLQPQSMATVVVTVRKISAPNSPRVYITYINNNGL
jgi:uncharacterized protein (TIGR02598 family)